MLLDQCLITWKICLRVLVKYESIVIYNEIYRGQGHVLGKIFNILLVVKYLILQQCLFILKIISGKIVGINKFY